MMQLLTQLHTDLFFWFHSFSQSNSEFHGVITFVANTIDNYVLVLALLTFLFFILKSFERKTPRRFFYIFMEMIRILTAVCVSWGLSYVIKHITKLSRPYLRFPEQVTALFPYGGFDSFPSGHATLFMALAVMMMLHHRRVGFVFLFFAVIISLARIIAGVHFPVDIVMGWIIGGGISLLIYRNLKI